MFHAVFCSDERMRCVGKMLESCGHTVMYIDDISHDGLACCSSSFDMLQECQSIVLPVAGGSRWEDYVCGIADKLSDKCIIFGWNVPEVFKKNRVYDFKTDERVAALNAIATAEGCIAEMIIYGKTNIAGSRCLITGYGRCAKEISSGLSALGAFVTVAARDSLARYEAACRGMDVCNMFERDSYTEYGYVINTVPAMVIGRREADKMNDDVVIIDIASKPGGTDFAYCRERGIKAIHSLGLPGKYSPKTSGEILGNAIIKVIEDIYDE